MIKRINRYFYFKDWRKVCRILFNFCKISTLKYDEGCLKEEEDQAHLSAGKNKLLKKTKTDILRHIN